jgi:hypothetical protein
MNHIAKAILDHLKKFRDGGKMISSVSKQENISQKQQQSENLL